LGLIEFHPFVHIFHSMPQHAIDQPG
jgi:hypothetical protein